MHPATRSTLHSVHSHASIRNDPKVAFVYDWLVNYNIGGGEKVLAALMEIWPDAPTFTIVHDPSGPCGLLTHGKQIKPSLIQHLPGSKNHHRLYLPLMPYAIEQFDTKGFDLLISCSHAFAHGILTRPSQLHLNYIFTPFRYAWELNQDELQTMGLSSGIKGWLLKNFLQYYRKWDFAAASKVDHFIAISRWVAQKVQQSYQRSADVIYPPVDIAAYQPEAEKEDYYLTVSRLVPYKRVDLITEAFSRMPDKQLIVIGEGPEKKRLAGNATGNIRFLGYQPFEVVKSYFEHAKAFIFSAVEDFGIAPLEAQAAGTPVIGYRRGGLVETVIENETGIFFDQPTPESLIESINRFEINSIEFDADRMHQHAATFSKERFQNEMLTFVNKRWSEFISNDLSR